mgnify:CR=1 FL=1
MFGKIYQMRYLTGFVAGDAKVARMVRALEDNGVMPYIKRFAGASAGALAAALLALGLTSEQLSKCRAFVQARAEALSGRDLERLVAAAVAGLQDGHVEARGCVRACVRACVWLLRMNE